MGRIIAICNQKGGVGKTTTATNLATSLSFLGYRVLLLDLDPQGNSTNSVGIDADMVNTSTSDIFLSKCNIKDAIIKTAFGIDAIPATKNLAILSTEIKEKEILKSSLAMIKDGYDFIIMDCPPSLGILNYNALVAANSLIIPVQCQYYAFEGLISLLSTIRYIQTNYNEKLDVEGILLTMYDARTNLDKRVYAEVKEFFKEKVFETSIPQSIKIPLSQSKKKPIMFYDKKSNVAQAYIDLAKEVVSHNGWNH